MERKSDQFSNSPCIAFDIFHLILQLGVVRRIESHHPILGHGVVGSSSGGTHTVVDFLHNGVLGDDVQFLGGEGAPDSGADATAVALDARVRKTHGRLGVDTETIDTEYRLLKNFQWLSNAFESKYV